MLRAALKGAGISSPDTTDIRYDIWHKLMANLTGSTVALILGQPSSVQKTPLVNRMCRRAHAEALAVAARIGRLTTIPTCAGPSALFRTTARSILQDRPRPPMEIDRIVRAHRLRAQRRSSTRRRSMPSNRSRDAAHRKGSTPTQRNANPRAISARSCAARVGW
jgi:ketopantoate reductase